MDKYWKQQLGKKAEQYVADYISKNGWQIQHRNWRFGRLAEIDIIAFDPEHVLVFIEVKSRTKTNDENGFPNAGFDKLDKRKLQKITSCARVYMAKNLLEPEKGCRFDAFVLYYPSIEHHIVSSPQVQYIKNFLT